MVIDTGCTGSCKSNYHTITTTTDAKSKKDKQYNNQIRKDRQYNDQIRKDKKTKNDRQNTTQKTKDWETSTPLISFSDNIKTFILI